MLAMNCVQLLILLRGALILFEHEVLILSVVLSLFLSSSFPPPFFFFWGGGMGVGDGERISDLCRRSKALATKLDSVSWPSIGKVLRTIR